MPLSPVIAIHLAAALAALLIGPLALWARRQPGGQRPRLHRAADGADLQLFDCAVDRRADAALRGHVSTDVVNGAFRDTRY